MPAKSFDELVARAEKIFLSRTIYRDERSGEEMPLSPFLAAHEAVDEIENRNILAAIVQEVFLRQCEINDSSCDGPTFDDAVTYLLVSAVETKMMKSVRILKESKKRR